jgi:hypothetical protein
MVTEIVTEFWGHIMAKVRFLAAMLVATTLTAPTYAQSQPNATPGVSGDTSAMPQASRGRFPHRKGGSTSTDTGILAASLFGAGFGVALIHIATNDGNGTLGPPVSGQ